MGSIKLQPRVLYAFIVEVFQKLGVPNQDAITAAEVLLAADLRGIDSHGIARLKRYVDGIIAGTINPITEITVVRETPVSALIDGGNGLGQVIGRLAMEKCIKLADRSGIGFVGVRNSNHYGIAGYYSMMALKKDMIGISLTNARPAVAPTFGVEPIFGTNPISVAVPTDDEYPFVLDMATSITQRGKIEILSRQEKDTPLGLVIDERGESITDPKRILVDLISRKAALLPLGGLGEQSGGHKGYGLAFLVDILCSALTRANFGIHLSGIREEKKVKLNLGHFFGAIKIDIFRPVADFKKTVTLMMKEIKMSKKVEGEDKIYIHGEKEFKIAKERRRSGIPIDPKVYQYMHVLKKELDLKTSV